MKKHKALQDKAKVAFLEAIREVIKNHKKTGIPLPIWEKGKLKYISAKSLQKE